MVKDIPYSCPQLGSDPRLGSVRIVLLKASNIYSMVPEGSADLVQVPAMSVIESDSVWVHQKGSSCIVWFWGLQSVADWFIFGYQSSCGFPRCILKWIFKGVEIIVIGE